MNKITFERQVNEDLFYHILTKKYFDTVENIDFENDTFALRHYDWTGKDERPNFEHKKSGFKLWWYKYPLRSPEVNFNINHEQFSCILYDCVNSLPVIISWEIDKFWENKENKQ